MRHTNRFVAEEESTETRLELQRIYMTGENKVGKRKHIKTAEYLTNQLKWLFKRVPKM